MSAHREQIASYFDGLKGCEVMELRCTECRVVVETFERRALAILNSTAEVQLKIRDAWARHATPPNVPDFQI